MHDTIKGSLVMVAGLAFLAACEDPWAGTMDPLMVEDTFEIAAPRAERAELPSALDVIAATGRIGGTRFPESEEHALRWDVVLRETADGLVFMTPTGVGVQNRARLSVPILERSIEAVDRATGLVADTAAVDADAVYLVRSRRFNNCEYFAKFTPIELDREAATATLRVISNGRCGDDRLPNLPEAD